MLRELTVRMVLQNQKMLKQNRGATTAIYVYQDSFSFIIKHLEFVCVVIYKGYKISNKHKCVLILAVSKFIMLCNCCGSDNSVIMNVIWSTVGAGIG